jgi:hypothetical protein
MLWTTATFEALAIFMYRDGGVFVHQAVIMMVIFAAQILLGSLWLLLLIFQKSGRKWLLTVYYDKDIKKMGSFGCFMVRAMPVIETVAIIVLFSSGNQ